MFNKDKEYAGVTLIDDCLKVAHVRVGQNQQILGVAKKDVHGVAAEELPNVARTLLNELGLKKPLGICVISSNIVTTKNIEVPSIDPAEIKSIIDLQAGRHTPYAREEIVISYITIGTFQRNYTKVLLVIVNREQVMNQVKIMAKAGIQVEKVVFAPEAAAMFYARVLKVTDDAKPVGIIDVNHDSTDFIMECNRTVITSRTIPVGMNHLIKEGAGAQEKLLAELQQSMEVYQGEDIAPPPEQFLLTSDDAKLQELKPALQTRLKTNINTNPYLDSIQAAQPVMMKLVSEYNDDSFLGVIAASALSGQVTVDLTPDELRSQRAIEEKGKQLIFTGIFGLVILVLICTIAFSKIYFRGVILDKLKADYKEKHKIKVELDEIGAHTRIVKDFVGDRMIPLEVLKLLYQMVPEEMYLQNISLEENGTIIISGISESMSRVFNLVTALEDSDLFKNVKTKSTATKQERGKDVASFEIEFRLETAPDEEETKEGEGGKGEKKDEKKESKKEGAEKAPAK